METETAVDTTIRYRHLPVKVLFTQQPKRKSPVYGIKNAHITIAYVVDGTDIQYGIAYCAPCDQFSRDKGRLISTGRLNKRPMVIEAKEGVSPADMVINEALSNLPCRWNNAIG